MEQKKRDFQASRGLLEDVMRKQAGSIEKAVLEAVMNSVDANAENIRIQLNETHLTVKDDGDGLSEEEVEKYFERFGYKDDDVENKEFGKFRIGRGQIFNFGRNVWRSKDNALVVNLDEDETVVGIDGEEHELDTSGLSYNLIKTDEPTDGCNIIVDLYNNVEDISGTVSKIQNLIRYVSWVHDVTISINEQDVGDDFVYEFETDEAWFSYDDGSFSNGVEIYNQGAHVTTERETPVKINAVSKEDLDVNFARNALLDTCEVTPKIIEQAKTFCFNKLIEKDDFRSRQIRWLLKEADGDDNKLKLIYEKQLFRDVKGEMWSLDQMSNEKIAFKPGGGNMARRAMDENGIIVIDGDYKSEIENLVENSEVLDYRDVVEKEMKWEMREVDESELSTKRHKNLVIARDFLKELNFKCEVKPGHSQEEDVWKDSEGTVYIDRGYLNSRKQTFLTEGLLNVYRIACHDGSTQTGFDDDLGFKTSYAKRSGRLGEVIKDFQNK